MKTTKNTVLSLALLFTLAVTAIGGETHNPPLPTCDPLTQDCPVGGSTQSVNPPAEDTADTSTISVPADVVVTLVNLTLSLIG